MRVPACQDIPTLMPLSDALKLDTCMVALGIPGTHPAFAPEPRRMVVLHIVAYPLRRGDVEIWGVAGEVNEDHCNGIVDDGALNIELPR